MSHCCRFVVWLLFILLAVDEAVMESQLPTITINKSTYATVIGRPFTLSCGSSPLQQSDTFVSLEMKYMTPEDGVKGLAITRKSNLSEFSFQAGYKYFTSNASDIKTEHNISFIYMAVTLPIATCRLDRVSFWCKCIVSMDSSGVSVEQELESERINFDLVGML